MAAAALVRADMLGNISPQHGVLCFTSHGFAESECTKRVTVNSLRWQGALHCVSCSKGSFPQGP